MPMILRHKNADAEKDARVGHRELRLTPRTWERLSLVALLCATALLYMVGLSASGYANEFYSAAAQAGSTNWWSFLWGSSDAANSITVDKPPAALWPMALSVRLFGLSSWSILLPQAIMGVLSVWVLAATVRRSYGHWCGILAGAMLATTPVACRMFRFNNPDALLVLLMLCATHCVVRAIEPGVRGGGRPDGPGASGECIDVAADVESACHEGRAWVIDRAANRRRTLWMALAGVAMGFAFLAKQLQAFLVLPAFALAFLVASPTRLRRRVLDSIVALLAMTVSAGWWVLLTVVVPASERPYIGGSQTNSFIELTFSYNGLGRITGSMTGAVVPGASVSSQGQAGMWGQTGITRLFDGVWGTQWSWLFWLAAGGLVVAVAARGRAGRSDARRAQAMLWGAWLLVSAAVFSFMGGTIHQYYTVALAPAASALAAIGVRTLWESRDRVWAAACAPVATLASAVWASVLLGRSSWMGWLSWVALGLGTAAANAMVLAWLFRAHRAAEKDAALAGVSGAHAAGGVEPAGEGLTGATPDVVLARVGLGLALAAVLVGPVSYSLYTASAGHNGSIVTAGPTVEGDSGMGSGGMGQGGPGGDGAGGDGVGGMGQDGAPAAQGQPGSDGQRDADSTDGAGAADGVPTGEAPTDGRASTGGEAPADDQQNASGVPAAQQGEAPAAGDATDGGGMADGAGQGPGGQGGAADGAPSAGMSGAGQGVSDEVTALLESDADSYTWVAAANGSQSAAGYQLACQLPVMPVGGFNGSDPSPTLEQFKAYVEAGKIHYYIAGGTAGGGGGSGTQLGGSDASSQIASWVSSSFESTTVGGVTLYDLTKPVS